MDLADEAEYSAKLAATATTYAEKMSVLEARDRLMRLRRLRQTDLATAVAVVGTCPDMCPEFERYFRIETNQVSHYEMDAEGIPDENRMIKEYRRSGADQEEPLAHELRPSAVLTTTMDYLCCNIMDVIDPTVNCGDWYDFVWSRSRSIRKDITQQHLCDIESVQLTEKCARFHIHCAAALCQQDLKDFDPKINEENLSNCLQSLKDLYYDLSLRGVFCDNEPEFRCYEILLHLNDTAILRDVQNYRQSIRDSREVQFAVKAFFAYHSNNYIQFFKLLNQSSYLMACVLHRYFVTIRLKAFKILRKSYTSNNSSVQEYPSHLLIDCLGFEDLEELTQFCDDIGLEWSDDTVYLIRGQNQNTSIKPNRSVRLIESKRIVSVGEIINGKPLPPNPYHTNNIYSSFDTDSKLKAHVIEHVDQHRALNTQTPSKPQIASNLSLKSLSGSKVDFSASLLRPQSSVGMTPIKTKSLGYRVPSPFQSNTNYLMTPKPEEDTDGLGIAIRDELIDLVTKQLLTQIYNEELKRYELIIAQQMVCQIFSELLLETTDLMVEEYAIHVINNENELKAKESERIEMLTNDLYDDMITHQIKHISQLILNVCRDEYNEKLNELIAKEIFNQMMTDMTATIASDIISDQMKERLFIIEIIRENHIKRLEYKYFNKWKYLYLKQKRFNQIRQSFPAAPKCQPTHPTIHTNHPYSYSQQTFDDTLNNSIQIQLLSNSVLNQLVDVLIKDIAIQVMQLSNIGIKPIYEYLHEKRCKRLQKKYLHKWKYYCFERRRHLRRKAFPAAPNWGASQTDLSQIEYSFTGLDSQLVPEISAKRVKRDIIANTYSPPKDTPNSATNLKHLMDEELTKSKEFTQRLQLSLTNISAIEPISDDSIDQSQHNIQHSPQLYQDIEVNETLTDKRQRLSRLLAEERDYFSYHNFVHYLSQNYFSDSSP